MLHKILQTMHKTIHTIFNSALSMWTTKCKELVGHNPAEISIFNFLEIKNSNPYHSEPERMLKINKTSIFVKK